MRNILCLFFLIFFVSETMAHDCSREDAMKAEDIAGTLKNWGAAYSAFKHYGHCDDGSISEGFTDSIVHMLSAQWSSLPQGIAFTKKDAKFHAFVLRHIDASADTDELKEISKLSKSQCPNRSHTFCEALRKKADTAVSEIHKKTQ